MSSHSETPDFINHPTITDFFVFLARPYGYQTLHYFFTFFVQLIMTFPDNCKYTEDHEWVRIDSGNTAYVGITDFAQIELGDLVYVEVETVGKIVKAHGIFGTVEAVKTTSDLFMPLSAKVLEFNSDLDDAHGGNPSLLNEDPYGKGWIIKIEIQDAGDLASLMNAEAYKTFVGK